MTMSEDIIAQVQDLLLRDVEHDDREPVATVLVPGLGYLGFLVPHPTFWMQLSVVLSIQTIINVIVAVSIYYTVFKRRGSMTSYLIGYGVICPALVVVPFQISMFLGLHNMGMLVGQAASMSVVLFCCLMTIHATLPNYVEQDLRSFVMYFVSPLQFVFDEKSGEPVPLTREAFQKSVLTTIEAMVTLAVVVGLMKHCNYQVVPRPELRTILDHFRWRHLLNNYLMAFLTGSGLATGTLMVGTIIEFLTGKKVIQLTNHPMTQSTSPSDFWGRHWNSLVHIVLKGGVYIPLRKNGFSKGFAAFVTFATSGLLHEYVLVAIALKAKVVTDHVAITPRYGYHTAFFAWNGAVLCLEGLYGKHPLIQEMKRRLPAPIITALVILTVLPIGHWFTDEYVETGFYDDLSVGMPLVTWEPFRYEVR